MITNDHCIIKLGCRTGLVLLLKLNSISDVSANDVSVISRKPQSSSHNFSVVKELFKSVNLQISIFFSVSCMLVIQFSPYGVMLICLFSLQLITFKIDTALLIYLSHAMRKCVFRSLRPGQTQTGRRSHRS